MPYPAMWRRCSASTSLTSVPIFPISLCTGRPLRRTVYLHIRKRTAVGLTPMKSLMPIRNGLTLQGCLPPQGKVRQTASHNRRCRTRFPRKVWWVFSTVSIIRFPRLWRFSSPMYMSRPTMRAVGTSSSQAVWRVWKSKRTSLSTATMLKTLHI